MDSYVVSVAHLSLLGYVRESMKWVADRVVMQDTEHNPLAWKRHEVDITAEDTVPEFMLAPARTGVVKNGEWTKGQRPRDPALPIEEKTEPIKEEEIKKADNVPPQRKPVKPPPPPAEKEVPKAKPPVDSKQVPLQADNKPAQDGTDGVKKPTKEEWEKKKPAEGFVDQPKTDQWKEDTPNAAVDEPKKADPPAPATEKDPFERMHNG